ncbi:hypothetical protein E2C01_058438 [Portunus trituberculatus]|uniref:Uncharacterized protein n=1 Tax=Portunus trituberculatus TaxID=210409 RepID=A0A5B7H3R0_PORTR|nr:hypothetical protein [Portunus trituberculatus]
MDAISLQEVALTLLKNLGSSSRSVRDRGGESANHSETTEFSPSPGKFKPRKFTKTDVVVRLCLEVNPKWVALSEILDEIQKEVNESKHFEKCLVVTQDDRTSQQLREVSRSRT